MLEEIPGYREALAEESEGRDYAILNLPRKICGIDVVQMTLRHLVTRLAIACPFVCGTSLGLEPEELPGAIASFIWHVSAARARSRDVVYEYQARQSLCEILAGTKGGVA